jgi:hypothetical protein
VAYFSKASAFCQAAFNKHQRYAKISCELIFWNELSGMVLPFQMFVGCPCALRGARTTDEQKEGKVPLRALIRGVRSERGLGAIMLQSNSTVRHG